MDSCVPRKAKKYLLVLYILEENIEPKTVARQCMKTERHKYHSNRERQKSQICYSLSNGAAAVLGILSATSNKKTMAPTMTLSATDTLSPLSAGSAN